MQAIFQGTQYDEWDLDRLLLSTLFHTGSAQCITMMRLFLGQFKNYIKNF